MFIIYSIDEKKKITILHKTCNNSKEAKRFVNSYVYSYLSRHISMEDATKCMTTPGEIHNNYSISQQNYCTKVYRHDEIVNSGYFWNSYDKQKIEVIKFGYETSVKDVEPKLEYVPLDKNINDIFSNVMSEMKNKQSDTKNANEE